MFVVGHAHVCVFHGRRRGGGQVGLDPNWILKFIAKKSCFLSFEWEKTNFITFGPPGKILKKSPSSPPRKNLSDAHGVFILQINTRHFKVRL